MKGNSMETGYIRTKRNKRDGQIARAVIIIICAYGWSVTTSMANLLSPREEFEEERYSEGRTQDVITEKIALLCDTLGQLPEAAIQKYKELKSLTDELNTLLQDKADKDYLFQDARIDFVN